MRANALARSVAALALGLGAAGCATLPKDALRLEPDSMAKRQLQTRRFDGIPEADLLAASAGVLQDLGFNLDESETRLGLIVASKQRSAVEAGQVVGAMLLALLGATPVWDRTQRIRVCLVSRPASDDPEPRSYLIRVTFQRTVWNTSNNVSRVEAIEEPPIYEEFFQKLSQSVFLEAQKI
ncbi:MAG TPA: hypothetical protein VFR85_17725 [Anaeromyxobacteraceae bacterium]|nr:hypothetical protein [Anaeromyxobacteraceae bacterium]